MSTPELGGLTPIARQRTEDPLAFCASISCGIWELQSSKFLVRSVRLCTGMCRLVGKWIQLVVLVTREDLVTPPPFCQ